MTTTSQKLFRDVAVNVNLGSAEIKQKRLPVTVFGNPTHVLTAMLLTDAGVMIVYEAPEIVSAKKRKNEIDEKEQKANKHGKIELV